MSTLSHEQRTALHREALAGFVDAVQAAPDATVPAYPTWTVRDLGAHVVAVHTMAATAIETGSNERPVFTNPATPGDDVDTLVAKLHAAAEHLDTALATTSLTEVWVLLPGQHPQAWRRRVLMEATLHRYDAELAAGTPTPPSDELGRDGIDEFLALHARRGLQTSSLHGVVELRTDGASWQLDLASSEVRAVVAPSTPASHAGTEPGAVVHGPPAALWLWCNRREPLPADVHVDDRDRTGEAFVGFLDSLGGPAG